jgi:hypothetical protein
MFFNTTFRRTLLFIILFELISLCGYLWPLWNKLFFIILAVSFLIICLKRLDVGVYIILAELFIGSKGYLFYYDLGGALISIRIAFWLIIMGVWFMKASEYLIKKRKNKNIKLDNYCRFFKSKLFYYFIALFAIFGLGLILGFINGNSFNNIFDDFNAYLFFGLILVFYDTIVSQQNIERVMSVLAASLVAISLKTIALLYFFSHNFSGARSLYKWVRTSGVGEITNMGGNYYRIFFQSHIFIIIGFIIFLIFLFFNDYKLNLKNFARGMAIKRLKEKSSKIYPNSIYRYSAMIILLVAVILISLSRSFWIGLAAGLIAIFVYYLINENFSYKKFIINFIIFSALIAYLFFICGAQYYLGIFISILIFFYFLIRILKFPKRKVFEFTCVLAIIFALAIGFINNVVKFPWPHSDVDINLGELFGERAITISGEAAVGSRWSLLKPLSENIIKFPTILVGSGFGSTITYKSSDPRVLAENPSGEYTTYAFEWGYLDIWLKLGIIGLAAYIILIFKLFFLGLSEIKKDNWKIANDESRLILGLLLGLIIVFVIHCFTPYLNHPLGIGYLLLCVVIFDVFSNNLAANK